MAVVESMAIEPEFLWASERYLVRATHVVVTNLRPDHEEVVPGGAAAMAAAVSHVMPRKGRVFITDESQLTPILDACAARESSVAVVSMEGVAPLEVNRPLADRKSVAEGKRVSV